MTTATKIEQTNETSAAGLVSDAGNALNRIGNRVLSGLVAVGEMSDNARRARNFAYLSDLSDKDLAARGLSRGELAGHCFGPKLYL